MANLSNINNKFLVTTGGNVLIGATADTGFRLHVTGGPTRVDSYLSLGNNGYIRADTANMLRFQSGTADITFYNSSNSVEHVRIKNNTGNVGIGTDSPSAKLHVYESDTIDVEQKLDRRGAFSSWKQTSNGGVLELKNSVNSSKALIQASGNSYFNGGNVGIGVTLPSWNLQVAGRALVADTTARLPFYVSRAGGGAVTNAATIVSGAAAYFNGNIAGSDALRIGSMDNGTGAYYIDVSNYAGTAAYNLILQPFLGNVGIGTTTPDVKLDIEGTGGEILRLRDTDGSYTALTLYNDATSTDSRNWGIFNNGYNYGDFNIVSSTTNTGNPDITNATRLTITKDGNVGIGTHSPVYNLVVSNGGASGVEFAINTASGLNEFLCYNRSAGAFETLRTQALKHEWFTNATTYAMVILDNGNVGIGVTSPSQKLHVVGKGLFTDDIQLTQTNPRIDYGNSTAGALRFWSVDENNEKMRLNSNGNMGVGTTTPYSLLEVDGVISNKNAFLDGNLTVTTVGMNVEYGGSLQLTQGFSGTSSAGDTVVFRYNATSWKSWSLDYTFASTNGLVKGTIGGYNNNSGGGSNSFLTNTFGITAVATGSGQNVIVTFTGNFGIHMMCDMRYSQGGGDGSPRSDRAILTYNS